MISTSKIELLVDAISKDTMIEVFGSLIFPADKERIALRFIKVIFGVCKEMKLRAFVSTIGWEIGQAISPFRTQRVKIESLLRGSVGERLLQWGILTTTKYAARFPHLRVY